MFRKTAEQSVTANASCRSILNRYVESGIILMMGGPKMKHKLSPSERETTIRYDAETKQAIIDTVIPGDILKLDRLVEKYPETYRVLREDPDFGSKVYTCPAKYVRFGMPPSAAVVEAARRNSHYSPKNATDSDTSDTSAM